MMNVGLVIFSLLFLVGNYLAYKEKISAFVPFLFVFLSEGTAGLALYFWQGGSRQLMTAFGLIVLFSVLALILARFLPGLHPLIWAEIVFLVQAGSFMLYRIDAALAVRHIIICLLGLVLILPIHWLVGNFRTAPRYYFLYYIAAVGLLLMNNVTMYGATNWTQIQIAGIGRLIYQPSEFVKILYSLFLASFLLQRFSWRGFLTASFLSMAVVGILVWQRDLGGAFIFFIIYAAITYMYSHNKLLLLGQWILAAAAAGVSIFFFSHVRVRIISWLYPLQYAQNESYQIVRSLQALMNGRWWGTGLGCGAPERIPVVTSDFLFAAIGEEYGAFYLLLFVLHFLCLLLFLYNQCLKSQNKFYFYAGTGLTTMLAVQGFLIMGGSSCMIPLTGVVLPFVSYGGSAMLGNFAVAGMIENMSKLSEQEQIDVMGAAAIDQDLTEVWALSKYIRLLKAFVLVLYLALTLYLIWLYQFSGIKFG